MSKFITPLKLELMLDANDKQLKNRSGKQLYRVISDFSYQSDLTKSIITVNEGFVTDLASIPRIPLVYSLLADEAQQAAVIHDYIYDTRCFSRRIADDVLYEACLVSGVSGFKSNLIYGGVRLGGGIPYRT